MSVRFFFSTALLLALFTLRLPVAQAAPRPERGAVWVVSPQGPLTSLEQALRLAADGDTIRVIGGTYRGPLRVTKSVHLLGEAWPVIDGQGQGMVVSLEAPGIRMEGFQVRGSGSEPDRDHAGIKVAAPDIHVENNRLEEVLFGIFVAQADRAVLRNNFITSMSDLETARKGDAIRLWYSRDVTVEGNQINHARDLVAWYSDNLVFQNNQIRNGRYGVHLMYCDQARIAHNVLLDNSVGIYVMYSQRVTLLENDIRRQRGPSGYALGFKDADDILVQGNVLVDNRAGVFIDGTPFRPGSYARFVDNIIAFNDIGVLLFSFVKQAEFEGNTFWENLQQTALQGSGKAGINTWSGNYWSDYSGFDADGDGVGDLPYRSERYFESLIDQEPRLRALLFSPAVQAIELASVSFPMIKPLPKLEDAQPLVSAREIPEFALSRSAAEQRYLQAIAGGMLLLVGLWVVRMGFKEF